MAQTVYTYYKEAIDRRLLEQTINDDASITTPLVRVDFLSPGLNITFSDALAPAEKSALDSIVAAHAGPTSDSLGRSVAGDVKFETDFLAPVLTQWWGIYASGGGSSSGTQQAAGGVYRITSGNAAGRYITLGFYDPATTMFFTQFLVSQNVSMIARVRNLETVNSTSRVGFASDRTNAPSSAVWFTRSNTDNWQSVTRSGGVSTTKDTGVPSDTNWHTLQIMSDHRNDSVKFYIDGVLRTTHTGTAENVPVSALIGPSFQSQTASVVTMSLDIDYVKIFQERQ